MTINTKTATLSEISNNIQFYKTINLNKFKIDFRFQVYNVSYNVRLTENTFTY